MRDTYIIIPAYKPKLVLNDLVSGLRYMWIENFGNLDKLKIIIIDDGSGKSYQPIFSTLQNKAIILYHDFNQGKGRALKTAYKFLKEFQYKDGLVVTVDADGQHKLEDILKLVIEFNKEENFIYLGSRRFTGKVPIRSRFGNFITRKVFYLVTSREIFDTQTGLRAFPTRYLDFMLSIQGNRYEYEMNVLLKSVEKNIPIKEIEIATLYENNNESSHFKAIRDSIRIYGVILEQIFAFASSSLLSFFIDYIMFLILGIFGISLILSNILARLISSSFNFILNSKFVFKNEKYSYRKFLKYFMLAFAILMISTSCIYILNEIVLIPKLLAKLIVESIIFIFSWKFQKKYIFLNDIEKNINDKQIRIVKTKY